MAIHFILQGKGGVGKSLVASILAQFSGSKNKTILTFDTDPVQHTLAGYKAFDTKIVEIMDGSRIDQRRFDGLVEDILSAPEDAEIIIDNGASSFVPLNDYLLENEIFTMLNDAGKEVILHTVVTGGQAAMDTILGFAALANFGQKMVVWKNQYFGMVEFDGKMLEETKPFKEAVKNGVIGGVVEFAARNPDTFGKDMQNLLSQKLTFEQALAGDFGFNIVARQRLNIVKKELFEQLDTVFGA